VWVDGAPRVACVTPVRRVAGRQVTTLDGLDGEVRGRWAEAFSAAGASQCGFCTPGIIMRLAGLEARRSGPLDTDSVTGALLAHLCRCTGWQTIVEAATDPAPPPGSLSRRDGDAARRRARLEGGVAQSVGPEVALGRGGFSDDTAPADALVAVPGPGGEWVVAETLREARAQAGKVQGRKTTLEPSWPLEVPEGDWDLSLVTTWVEPAYLETDASWCQPGGEPYTPLANGGAFGGKADSDVARVARELADRHGRAVRVVLSREDSVRRGAKRPPMAAGLRADGSGILRVVRTPGIVESVASAAPQLTVEEVDGVPGPATSAAIRGAGWMEAAVLLAGLGGTKGVGESSVTSPSGATARVVVEPAASGEMVRVEVSCGEVLDATVLRSYCIGAAHMGLGWVRSEGLAVDPMGEVQDLTIRSFGILRARDMPKVEVDIIEGSGPPVNGSDAVMAAVAAAVWLGGGLAPRWPTARGKNGGTG
jgi:xanthine dehydrogenase small subunit